MIKDIFIPNDSIYNQFQLSDKQRSVLEKSVFDKHEEEIKRVFSNVLGVKKFESDTITHDEIKRVIEELSISASAKPEKRPDYYDSHVGFNGL